FVYPKLAPCLPWPATATIVASSRSSAAPGLAPRQPRTLVRGSLSKPRSSWRRCPNGNERKNRAQPRGRHHAVPEHPLRLAATQHARVVDRITANKRRADKRQQFPARPSRTRPRTEINRLIHDLLDPEPPGERAREHKARVRDRALIIKSKHEPIDALPTTPSNTPRSRHHTDDLLSAGLAAARTARLACSGGHSRQRAGQPTSKRIGGSRLRTEAPASGSA